MRLGDILRGWMLHREKSLRSLGDEIGVDQATLHRFMSGKNPDGNTLARVLCYVLDDSIRSPEQEARREAGEAQWQPLTT